MASRWIGSSKMCFKILQSGAFFKESDMVIGIFAREFLHEPKHSLPSNFLINDLKRNQFYTNLMLEIIYDRDPKL